LQRANIIVFLFIHRLLHRMTPDEPGLWPCSRGHDGASGRDSRILKRTSNIVVLACFVDGAGRNAPAASSRRGKPVSETARHNPGVGHGAFLFPKMQYFVP
jgi:hypothetical protein